MRVLNSNPRFIEMCYEYSTFDSEKFYCALGLTHNLTRIPSGICNGDSGGPLLSLSNDQWSIYGISSFVLINRFGICLTNKPSYYTRITSYLEWINTTIFNNI